MRQHAEPGDVCGRGAGARGPGDRCGLTAHAGRPGLAGRMALTGRAVAADPGRGAAGHGCKGTGSDDRAPNNPERIAPANGSPALSMTAALFGFPTPRNPWKTRTAVPVGGPGSSGVREN